MWASESKNRSPNFRKHTAMNNPSFDIKRESAARTYTRPELVEYGTLRDVTLTVGSTPQATADGGGLQNNNKTR